MAAAHLPTPRNDEKLVLIIEIQSPDAPTQAEYAEFDQKFTEFKQQLDDLVTNNFSGALKAKLLIKKNYPGHSLFTV
jgi:hypothetical protein